MLNINSAELKQFVHIYGVLPLISRSRQKDLPSFSSSIFAQPAVWMMDTPYYCTPLFLTFLTCGIAVNWMIHCYRLPLLTSLQVGCAG